MLNHSSAVEREETPHATKSTQDNNATQSNPATRNDNSTQNNNPTQDILGFNRIAVAYRRRAESVINDRSIDPQTRAIIRYALETADPWLAELLHRVDAGESLIDKVDFSQEPQARNDDDLYVDKIEALAEIICREGDGPDVKSAALLVLMAALEDSPQPKALANTAKHLAFNHCAERNLCDMVEAEVRIVEAELFAGKLFVV